MNKYQKLLKARYLILVFVILAAVVVGATPKVYADSKEFNFTTGCDDQNGSYTAILDITSPKDVFVKLGRPGQTVKVNVNQVDESLAEGCTRIGQGTVNGNTWTKMGPLTPARDGRVVLEVVSPALSNVPNANRPSVLLIDRDKPACTPYEECELNSEENVGYIKAPTTLQDKASLFVGIPHDPANDKLQKVDYYAGGRLVYSKAGLERFDMRYASSPGQELLRVAKYESGQQVVYRQTVPESFNDSIFNFIFRTLGLGTTTSAIILGLVVVILIPVLVYQFMKLYVRRYRRLVYHGLMRRETFRQRLGLYTEIMLERVDYNLERFYGQKFIVWLRKNKTTFRYIAIFWIVPLYLVILYFGVKNYVAVIYHVNGESMTYTFKDGQRLIVNRLPQTLAHFNHEQMKLNRGDVVVVNAIYGLVSAEQIQENEHTIVKRVLGLPGETVTIKNGVVEVYKPGSNIAIKVDQGSPWEATMRKDPSPVDITVTLAQDEIFLSGDNRPGSIDSRLNGPIKLDQVIGRVL